MENPEARSVWCVLAACVCCFAACGAALAQGLPPVPFPEENPFTQEKSDLGKILFWDAQLSGDSTISCGSCHQASVGGTDPRSATHPGVDGVFGTPDDSKGSPGVVRQDELEAYMRSELFGLAPQVTPRQAPPTVMAMYSNDSFWDGRAGPTFFDPVTGEVVVGAGGALESQAVGPPVSGVEMAHAGRDWAQIVDKLARSRPLALASEIPPDIEPLIGEGMTFPELFERAFGDTQISAARIGLAIATYQRTLVPDQTPWDLFVAGDTGALTPAQVNGLGALRGSLCSFCHGGSQFTDNAFHNVGLRPVSEDPGRAGVTGGDSDLGRFKTPSLRGAGLRTRFMHNGMLGSLEEVFDFYARRNGFVSFPENRDVVLGAPIAFPPDVQADIIDFIRNGLTDPRVASEEAPFDRPMLLSQDLPRNPAPVGGGVPGSGGVTPVMVALTPPHLGNERFKIGVDEALPGATAWVVVSESEPVGGVVASDEVLGPITLGSDTLGVGYGTALYPIPDDLTLDGAVFYMQWVIEDPGAPGGFSRSDAARVEVFCSMHGACIRTCAADLDGSGALNFGDVTAFLTLYGAGDPAADLDGSGSLSFGDVSAFLTLYGSGCP